MDLLRLVREEGNVDGKLKIEKTGEETSPLKTFKPTIVTSTVTDFMLSRYHGARAIMAKEISFLAGIYPEANAYEIGDHRGTNYPIAFHKINKHQHHRAISSEGKGKNNELTVIPDNYSLY